MPETVKVEVDGAYRTAQSLERLFLVFLILKLTGHIDWSWWWVTAPIWVTSVVAVVAGLVYLVTWWILKRRMFR